MSAGMNVVTGAFGYSGSHIARMLIERGVHVRTITAHPRRDHPLANQIESAPFNFDYPEVLARTMKGADVLFNTYWIRFPHHGVDFERAVENIRALIDAASKAGVRRIVHVSITNANPNSSLPYFRGKGQIENYLRNADISSAIVRPAVIFGPGEILLNNIAWLLRRVPVFGIPGRGEYRIQPVFVEDLARLAIDMADPSKNPAHESAVDAVGPETFTFNELVVLIARTVGSRARTVHLSPKIVLACARLIGLMTKDVTLTRDEIRGLMADLLVSHGPPTTTTKFSEWVAQNADVIGVNYQSEVARR